MANYLFTSESVTEGHPDKICDQISDAVLDAILEQDPQGRVACETCVTTGLVMVMGEISTSATLIFPRSQEALSKKSATPEQSLALTVTPALLSPLLMSSPPTSLSALIMPLRRNPAKAKMKMKTVPVTRA